MNAEGSARVFEFQTDEVVVSDLEHRALAALPVLMVGGQWPTVAEICERADAHPDAVRSCLAMLHGRYLVEQGSGSQRFARTVRGSLALERGVDRPSDYTRFGPSDEAGQPCMGGCGRLAPAPRPEPGGAADQGWLYNSDDDGFAWALVCPECRNNPEMVARVRACTSPREEHDPSG